MFTQGYLVLLVFAAINNVHAGSIYAESISWHGTRYGGGGPHPPGRHHGYYHVNVDEFPPLGAGHWNHGSHRPPASKPSPDEPAAEDFSYTDQGGSRNWRNLYPECGNYHQSPINLAHTRTKELPPLTFTHYFDNPEEMAINNTGHGAELKMRTKHGMPQLSGGPLEGTYELSNVHFHWGSNDFDGSEHMIGGRHYTMEAHLVHIKSEYGSTEEAIKHADGFAVVSFVLEVSGKTINKDFQRIVAHLAKIKKPAAFDKFAPASDAFRWFRERTEGNYFTYRGSLTTPPCSEVVTWMVFQKPILIGASQVEEFRHLRGRNNVLILDNHREVQEYQNPHVFFVRGNY